MRVETARDMLAAVQKALPADIGIFTAAVADWRSAAQHDEKIKKGGKGKSPALALVENPDILATIAKHASLRPPLVIGFAAETENLVAYATKKLAAKGCDWIVANDVSLERGVMGGHENQVQLVTAQGVENWPLMSKEAVAEELMRRAAAAFPRKAGHGHVAAAE
jgi:phosphopantothenoylcysteine decarboxylase/phosphopantothenate--cysteine ligase